MTLKNYIFWIFLAIGAVTFSNALHGPFMIDDRLLLGKQLETKPILDAFVPYKADDSLPSEERGDEYYRPVHQASLTIFYRLFGENYVAYHAFNLFLLIVAAWLIASTITLLFENSTLGVFTGLFYLVHPLNGIMVNYITASAFSLEVIFMTMALRLMFQGATGPGPIIFYALALGCHETAILFPFYVLTALIIAKRMDLKDALKSTSTLWAITAFYFVFRLYYASFNDDLFAKIPRFHMNAGEHIASMVKVWFWYVTRFFYPDGIVIIWATPVVRENVGFWVLGGAVALVFLAAGLWKYRQKPSALLGLCWFIVGFLPLPLICLAYPLYGVSIEPHWFAFSSIGFFLFFASLLTSVDVKTAGRLIAAVLIVFWVLIARFYNHLWADEKRYYYYWLKQSPTVLMIQYNLGALYESTDKDLSRAGAYYERALAGGFAGETLYPKWGFKALTQGNTAMAWKYFYAAYQLRPHSWMFLNNLATAAFAARDYQKALYFFKKAYEIDPNSQVLQSNIAKTLRRMNMKPGEDQSLPSFSIVH